MNAGKKRFAAKWLAWLMVLLFVLGGAARTFAGSSNCVSARATKISRLAEGSDSKKSDDKKKDDDKGKDSDKGSPGKRLRRIAKPRRDAAPLSVILAGIRKASSRRNSLRRG